MDSHTPIDLFRENLFVLVVHLFHFIMSASSLANDPELQKFVAAKELENQLTAQVNHIHSFIHLFYSIMIIF